MATVQRHSRNPCAFKHNPGPAASKASRVKAPSHHDAIHIDGLPSPVLVSPIIDLSPSLALAPDDLEGHPSSDFPINLTGFQATATSLVPATLSSTDTDPLRSGASSDSEMWKEGTTGRVEMLDDSTQSFSPPSLATPSSLSSTSPVGLLLDSPCPGSETNTTLAPASGLDARPISTLAGLCSPLLPSLSHPTAVPSPLLHTLFSIPELPYLAHFIVHVQHCLPDSLQPNVERLLQYPGTRHAVIALAAADLANRQDARVSNYPTPAGHAPLVRDRRHQEQAAHHYGLAVQKIRNNDLPIEDLLSTVVFLAHYELEIGTIQGFLQHTIALKNLLFAHIADLAEVDCAEMLVRTFSTLHARMTTWVGVFRPVHAESPHPSVFKALVDRFCTDEEKVHALLAQSHQLSMRILLSHCLGLGGADSSKMFIERITAWYRVLRGRSPLPGDDDELQTSLSEPQCYSLLRSCRQDLNRLAGSTDCLALPGGKPALSDNPRLSRLGVHPIRFKTHREAMSRAYLALAFILSDEEIIRGLLDEPFPKVEDQVHPWLSRLIGIAEGLDLADCIQKNAYKEGIAWILMQAAQRCANPQIFDYIVEDFFPRMFKLGYPREDATSSLHLEWLCAKSMRVQVTRGRVVFCMASILDSTTEKHVIFDDSEPFILTLHGREVDGMFFNDCISST